MLLGAALSRSASLFQSFQYMLCSFCICLCLAGQDFHFSLRTHI